MKMTPIISFRVLRMLAVVGLVLGLSNLIQAQDKIGVIDLKKVFDGYYKTKQADSQLKDRVADYEKVGQGMVEDLQTAQADYQRMLEDANSPALSEEERGRRKTEAEKKLLELKQIQSDVQRFQSSSTETLREQERRLRDRILEEIQEVITVQAEAQSLRLVLDTAATTANLTPFVLYHNGNHDLTDSVLNELNSRGPLQLPGETPLGSGLQP